MPCQGLATSNMGAQQREVTLNEVCDSHWSTSGHMDVSIVVELDAPHNANTHIQSLIANA